MYVRNIPNIDFANLHKSFDLKFHYGHISILVLSHVYAALWFLEISRRFYAPTSECLIAYFSFNGGNRLCAKNPIRFIILRLLEF